jgi:hypothetical protein
MRVSVEAMRLLPSTIPMRRASVAGSWILFLALAKIRPKTPISVPRMPSPIMGD